MKRNFIDFIKGGGFIYLACLIVFGLLLIGCDDDDDCSSPDLSTISEDSLIDMRDFVSGGQVKSPVFVTWGAEERVFQIYLNGNVIDPDTEHTPRCPGIEISLANDLYEFKLWIPGASSPEISRWVNVVDEIENTHEEGKQFDNKWITVLGDGCLPMITDYHVNYAKYATVDNTNTSYSQLVADAATLEADSEGEENETHIIHNITYLEKATARIPEGTHTASYFFQIPSFSTGITVEGGLFIWFGNEDVRLDYGTAFQLIVDEDDSNFGKVFYWGGNKWIDSGKEVELFNDFFYKVTFTVNVESRNASIDFEGKEESFIFSDIFSETEKDDTWTSGTVARFQAECISKDGMKHVVNFKDFYWFQNL